MISPKRITAIDVSYENYQDKHIDSHQLKEPFKHLAKEPISTDFEKLLGLVDEVRTFVSLNRVNEFSFDLK